MTLKAPGLGEITEGRMKNQRRDWVPVVENFTLISKQSPWGRENIGEEEVGCEFQLSLPCWRLLILNPDFVVGPGGCLYSVCYMLDIVIGAVDLPEINNL